MNGQRFVFTVSVIITTLWFGMLRGCSYLNDDRDRFIYTMFNSEQYQIPNWTFWLSIPITVLILQFSTLAHLRSGPRDALLGYVFAHPFITWGCTVLCLIPVWIFKPLEKDLLGPLIRLSYEARQSLPLLLVGCIITYVMATILAIRNQPQTPICFSVWTSMIAGLLYASHTFSLVCSMMMGLCLVLSVAVLSFIIEGLKQLIRFQHRRNVL